MFNNEDVYEFSYVVFNHHNYITLVHGGDGIRLGFDVLQLALNDSIQQLFPAASVLHPITLF